MPDTSQRPLPAPLRLLLAVFALLCIALGVVGIFVPGMPTTVFIIIAAWAAARSSPRLHAWLMGHRLFGPLLRNWQDGGRMSRRAKWSATAAMAFCALILLATTQRVWAASLALACMDGVLAWLWCRPEPV
jgi:uncharacterized membrane protein YbaN (DUF454 family)